MRMRAAMACALQERQMRRIVNRAGEFANRLGQSPRKIRNTDATGDFRFGQSAHVKHRLFVLNLLPLEAHIAPGHIEEFPVLAGAVKRTEEETPEPQPRAQLRIPSS